MDPKHGIQTKASGYRWKLWKYRVEDGQRGYESNGQKNNQRVLDAVENKRGLMEMIENYRVDNKRGPATTTAWYRPGNTFRTSTMSIRRDGKSGTTTIP